MHTFNGSNTYTLENEVVLLRPLEENDYSHLLKFALEEKEIWKYSLVSAAGEEGMKNYIRTALEEREKQTSYPFIVFDKRTGEYAGSTRFYHISIPHMTIDLGYTWYGKKFQGTGLNKHCKFLLLQFAFENLGMERVEFQAHSENIKSISAMKSIGCVEEGILRNNLPTIDGGRRNSIVLSIIKPEWFGSVKENLQKKIINLSTHF